MLNKEYIENPWNQERAQRLILEVGNCIRGSVQMDERIIKVVCYTLLKMKATPNPYSITWYDVVDGKLNISNKVLHLLKDEFFSTMLETETRRIWARLVDLLDVFEAEIFALAVLLPYRNISVKNTNCGTPKSIIDLSKAILNCSNQDKIADFCSGVGEFLTSVAIDNPQARYYGIEIDTTSAVVAEIKADVLGFDLKQENRNLLFFADIEDSTKYTKIFSNYPLGMKKKAVGISLYSNMEKMMEAFALLGRYDKYTESSDWMYNAVICDALADHGKAIAIMANAGTVNRRDAAYRMEFVNKGLVEAVINLPARMFPFSALQTTLIVFSKGNTKVRLVDATNLYKEGRRQNEFTEENIEEILDALNSDTEISVDVEYKELHENDFSLSAARYLEKVEAVNNGVQMAELVKDIYRCPHVKAMTLDEMHDTDLSENKCVKYVNVVDIQDGCVNANNLVRIEDNSKYQRYYLGDYSLLMTRNGFPYKTAIVRVKPGEKVIASPNIFVIRLDTSKVEPYYLQAFLESEQGQAALRRVSVGSLVANIGVEDLKKLTIPMVTYVEQDNIGKVFKANLDEIAIIKHKLQKALDRMKNVFGEERSGK